MHRLYSLPKLLSECQENAVNVPMQKLFKTHSVTNGFRFSQINQPYECQCNDCCGIKCINSILLGA